MASRWALKVLLATVVWAIGTAAAEAADTTVVTDHETGFVFSQYSAKYNASGQSVLYRIAVPSTAQNGVDFETVVQVVAPRNVGWAGLAWGGGMLNSPLTVTWANGQSGTVSSRFATRHALPDVYSGAQYELLTTGTHTNYTHWQVTAKCTGCPSYTSANGVRRRLNPKGVNRLAFAMSNSNVMQPANPNTNFPLHDVFGYWNHDFATAANTQFANLVTKNGGRRTPKRASGGALLQGRVGRYVQDDGGV